MRFRTILAGMLVCALVPLNAALAGTASARVLKGHTAQKHPIKIDVQGRTLRLLRFKATLKCADGSVLVDTESGFQPTRIGKGGGFHDVQVGSTDEVILKGRKKGGLVQGKIRVLDRLGKNRIKCHSPLIAFTLKPR